MRLCIQCGYPTSGPDDMCAHHVAAFGDDWAVGNRIVCDFLHRGIVSPPPEPRAATLTMFTEVEPAGVLHGSEWEDESRARGTNTGW